MNFTDVLDSAGVPAGMGAELLIAFHSDVVSCPDTPDEATATGYENFATVSGDITFGAADGTGFYKVPVRSTSEGKMKVMRTLDNADTGSFTNTFEAFRLNSNDPETIGFFKSFVGKKLVVLGQTAECGAGEYVRIGCTCNPARIATVEADSGSASGDDNGTTFTITNSGQPAPIYTGAITLASENV